MSEVSHAGGCLCGAVRYLLHGKPRHAGYCHCRICQRAHAVPAVAWGTWPRTAFEYTQGRPRSFASSEHGRREFCGDCGTHLVFITDEAPLDIDIALGALDAPERVRPLYHIWCVSRVPWFETQDKLLRFDDRGPDRPTEV